MKMTLISFAALIAISTPAMAERPNRVTMSFAEFIAASGCVIVDKGGYSNLAATDGGNCPASVIAAFTGVGTINVDPDGIPNTGDEYAKSDN